MFRKKSIVNKRSSLVPFFVLTFFSSLSFVLATTSSRRSLLRVQRKLDYLEQRGLAPKEISESCTKHFNEDQLLIARQIITCNQNAETNYERNCLGNFDLNYPFEYTDGTVKAKGEDETVAVFTNFFAFNFTTQSLAVYEEYCTEGVYIARYTFNMTVSFGNIENIPGMSIIKFNPENDKAVYLRDYFDELRLYENAPMIGRLLARITAQYASCLKLPQGCEAISPTGNFSTTK